MDTREIQIYEMICRHDGIRAAEIAKKTGASRTEVNRLLYNAPFIHDLCYRDSDYLWHGLIRQTRPHTGLGDYCGYYGTVKRFLAQSEDEWLAELKEGCRSIGRNLNDARGLIHSFRDCRQVMRDLFADLEEFGKGGESDPGGKGAVSDTNGKDAESASNGKYGESTPVGNAGTDFRNWEICFELRIRRARYVRIYADVLVITNDKVFSLEFKMKDVIDPEEELQAVKYAKYIEVIFGSGYEVIPALVLTGAADLYKWEQLPGSTAEVPVCSGDMLFNLFDEYIGFLGQEGE